MAAVVGEARGGHVVGQAGEAVQLCALVQRAPKLRQHDREALQSTETTGHFVLSDYEWTGIMEPWRHANASTVDTAIACGKERKHG